MQPAHFPVPALLLLASLPACALVGHYHGGASLPLVSDLLLALGAALCLVFRRWRQLSLLIWISALQALLLPDVAAIRGQAAVTPTMVTDFMLATTIWPAIYSLFALWPEQGRPLIEVSSRSLALAAALGGLIFLHTHPGLGGMQRLGITWWPALYASWMRLPQLSYPIAGSGLLLLGLQYLWEPRAQHAAQWLVLPACMAALPHIFIHPDLLPLICGSALLTLTASVIHESLHLAFRDELTGLPSRRALNEKLQQLSRQYCLAVIDIDHFKQCNDRYGHEVGDQVLRLVASRLRRGSRGRAYRQGGEEFVIVLDRCEPAAALAIVEAIREDIAGYPMQLRDHASRPANARTARRRRGQAPAEGPRLSVSVSIGLAASQGRHTVAEVLKRADKALYKAKAQGRNQTVQA